MDNQKYERLTTIADEKKFFGLIQIEEDNNIVYQYIQGFENREKNIPSTRDTLFAIASGTKFLTALAIGKLIDENKFSLDSKAKDLYDLKMDSIDPNITIRHLLSNTSGMADYLDEDLLDGTIPIYFGVPFKDLVNPKDFIPIFSKREQKSTPGEKFNYNNQGFVYLAIIVEEVSKKSYKDYINQEILRPLGITRSGIYHLDHFPSDTALGYLNNKEDSLTNLGLLPYQSGGDGGAICSVDELRTLWKSFFEYKIISKDLVNEFMKIQAVIDQKTNNYYGLGLWLKKNDDEVYPYLLGGDPGISFSSSYSPFTKKYKFAVSNTSHGVWDIFDIFKEL